MIMFIYQTHAWHLTYFCIFLNSYFCHLSCFPVVLVDHGGKVMELMDRVDPFSLDMEVEWTQPASGTKSLLKFPITYQTQS